MTQSMLWVGCGKETKAALNPPEYVKIRRGELLSYNRSNAAIVIFKARTENM